MAQSNCNLPDCLFRQYIYFQTVLVWLHLFPGVCKVTVYSYTAVQSLLTVLMPNLLCLKPSCECVSDHGSPRHLTTRGCSVHICLWLVKGLLLMQNSATVTLIWSKKLHVLTACNHSKLHLPFVIHIPVPHRTWWRKWMFRLCKHESITSISVLFYVKLP